MRYVAVPVEFGSDERYYYAALECKCDGPEYIHVEGKGDTKDDAFSDLLAKLGYKEAHVDD